MSASAVDQLLQLFTITKDLRAFLASNSCSKFPEECHNTRMYGLPAVDLNSVRGFIPMDDYDYSIPLATDLY